MIRLLTATVFLMLMVFPAVAHAGLEWSLKNQVELDSAPLDVATSLDGAMIFVLVPQEVLVFSAGEDAAPTRIPLDEGFDRVTYSPKDNTLILTSSSQKILKIVELQEVFDIDTSGLPHKGPAEAPVTIAVFSDYQCPYCTRLTKTLDPILEKYPEDVKLVFMNFPLAMHKSAKEAAMAALAANEQGKFWELHDLLFQNYKGLNQEKINELAGQLELDMEQFENDMKSERVQKLVMRDIQEAKEAGVRGTPTVFINGKLVKNKSQTGFQEMIEAELENENP